MKRWAFATAVLVFSASAWADSGTRVECLRNNIQSLHVSKIQKFLSLSDTDLCRSDAPEIPAKIVGVLDTVGSVQARVARALQMEPAKLFPQSIDLTLTSWELGSLDEGAVGNSVTISFFPDWDGEAIDQGGLAHELGHVIAGISTASMAIHDLRGNWLLNEGFPDLVAYNTFGHVFDRSNDLPAEIDELANRDLDTLMSFKQKLGPFLETAIFDQGQKICAALPADLQALPHVQSVCHYLKNPPVNPIEGYTQALARAGEPFTAQACVQMSDPSWLAMSCDVHVLSLPFTSFLVALSKKQGASFLQQALELLVRPDALAKHTLSCHYNSDAGRLRPVEVAQVDFADWLQALKGPSNLATWNSLWQQADLDQGLEMVRANQAKTARNRAYYRMRELYSAGGDSFYNDSNRCNSVDSVSEIHPPAECTISCEAK